MHRLDDLHPFPFYISSETFSPILQLLISPVFLGLFLLKVKEVYYYVKEDQSNKSIRSNSPSIRSRHGTLERQMNLVSMNGMRKIDGVRFIGHDTTCDKRRIQRAYLNNNKNIFVNNLINYNASG